MSAVLTMEPMRAPHNAAFQDTPHPLSPSVALPRAVPGDPYARVRCAACEGIEGRIMRALADDLVGVAPSVWRFFGLLFRDAAEPAPVMVQDVARRLGLPAPTLRVWFHRAGLPGPKRYLTYAALVRFAAIAEDPTVTIRRAAVNVGVDTQALNRMALSVTQLTASEFRRQVTGDAMVERFRADLVQPYGDALRKLVLPPKLGPRTD